MQGKPLANRGHFLTTFAVDPTGKWLAGVGRTKRGAGAVVVWDARSRKVEAARTVDGDAPIGAVAFSPDGRLLATSCWDDTVVRLWRVASLAPGARLRLIREDVKPNRYGIVQDSTIVGGLAFSPDGKHLAAGCWDRTVKLWDLKTRALRELDPPHRDNVDFVAFVRGGKGLISGTAGVLRTWVVKTGRVESETRAGAGQHVWSHTLSGDGSRLASMGEKGVLAIRDLASGARQRWATGIASRAVVFALSPDGRRLAIARPDRRVALLDLGAGSVTLLPRAERSIDAIAFTSDGSALVLSVSSGSPTSPPDVRLVPVPPLPTTVPDRAGKSTRRTRARA